jgi:hypothetical protein
MDHNNVYKISILEHILSQTNSVHIVVIRYLFETYLNFILLFCFLQVYGVEQLVICLFFHTCYRLIYLMGRAGAHLLDAQDEKSRFRFPVGFWQSLSGPILLSAFISHRVH